LIGGVAGFVVDQISCRQHHGSGGGSFLDDPCALYTAGGAQIGWFGGAIVGATSGAARAARERGCPRQTALARAFAGSVLGAAPGIIIVAGGPAKYPPSRSAFVAIAPLASGSLAALAVMSCHGP
jgi:hypothetical protein